MRGVRTEFVYANDDDHGMDGWKPKKQPAFNASEGLGVAHDAIEHFSLNGSLEDECMAMGACLYGRGMGGWFHQRSGIHDPAKNVGLSMGSILAFDVDEYLKETTLGVRRLDDSYAEDMVQSSVAETLKGMRDEIRYTTEHEDDFQVQQLSRVEKYFGRYLRLGYRGAEQRFRLPSWRLSEAFERVAHAAERAMKCAEIEDRLVVFIEKGTGLVEVRHHQFDDWYRVATV